MAFSAVVFPMAALGIPDGPEPSERITSMGIAEKTAAHYLSYTHYKVIGACLWWKCGLTGCGVYSTPELDEYLPDLVVSVYNGSGNNPWTEASTLLDGVSHEAGNVAVESALGFELKNGGTRTRSALGSHRHHNAMRTKSVDVVGNPFTLLKFPYLSLRVDAAPFVPYFQSDLDSLGDRTGMAESLRLETWTPFSNPIGTSVANHWGYEFPRSMTVKADNDYKASLMAALHAADIVTNSHTLHVAKGTNNSCGINCAVSNVIEETGEDHAIWQEIYPIDRKVIPGELDAGVTTSLGQMDESLGKGNYVFVIWRHYRGCVQGERFLMATETISETQKR